MKTGSNTRSRILTAARMAFAQLGFDSASMSRIAKQAKVDKSSLYYFFKDKEDLFASVTLDTWEQLSRSVSKNLQIKTGAKAKQVLSKTFQDIIKISLAAGMSSTRMELPIKDHPQFKTATELIKKTQTETLQFLIHQKVNRPEFAQSVIANSLHAYVLHSCTGKIQPPVKKYCDYLSSLIISN